MRQEAFQHHPTLGVRHELPCFIMSQSTQQQEGKTYSQSKSMSKEPAQDREVEMEWSLISVFSSHLLSLRTSSLTLRALLGSLCSCFQLSAPAQAWPSLCTPLTLLTSPFPLPATTKRAKSLLPLHRLVLQKPAGPLRAKFSWGRGNGTSDNTSSYVKRERKAGLTCLLAQCRKHKQWFSDHPARQCLPRSQAILPSKKNSPCCSPPSSTCCTSAPWHRAALEVVHFYVHTESAWQLRS